MENSAPPFWNRITLLFVLLAGFSLRLHELTLQDIWWDEARNIDVALRPFWQIATAPELDIHPPIYFWLLHLWGRLAGLGDSTRQSLVLLNTPTQIAFITRYLSVFAGVVGIALIYQLTRAVVFGQRQQSVSYSPGLSSPFRILPKVGAPSPSSPNLERRPTCEGGTSAEVLTPFNTEGEERPPAISSTMAAICATVFAALSPFWLAESQETRMYTVGFAVLLAAAIALLKVVNNQSRLSPSNSHLPLLSFVILSALALLIHYNAVFILFAWYLWWGLWALLRPDRVEKLKQLFLAGIAMSMLVLPVAPIALRQIPTYANPNLGIPTLLAYLQQNWIAYIAGYAWNPALGEWLLWAILGAALIGVLIALWSAVGSNGGNFSFLLFWFLGGLALYYIAVLDRGAFNVRYSSFVTPALYALLGISLAALARIWRPLTLCGLAVLLLGLVPAVHADLYEPAFARENISGLTDWLRTEVGPDDLILVDQKYPFGFYYAPYTLDTEIVQKETAHDAGAAARYLFVDINTIDQQLTAWASDAKRIYWVQWFESDTDPRRAVPFLLDQVGRRGGEKNFQGYSVDWWDLGPPNTFVLAADMQSGTHIFPPAVETVAYSIPSKIAPGAAIPIAIRWKRVTEGYTDRPLKARVALYEVGGTKIRGQDDRRLLNDRHRLPSEWNVDDRPLNVYMVPTPGDLATGGYEIRLLVYDAETLAPLTYVDIAGNPAGIEATLGTVVVE